MSQIEQLADPDAETAGGYASTSTGEAAAFVAPVAQAISASGGRLTDARLGEPNLEDVFIHLTGRALR